MEENCRSRMCNLCVCVWCAGVGAGVGVGVVLSVWVSVWCCTCVCVVRVCVCPGMGVRMCVSACVLVVQKIGAHVHQTDHVFRKLVSTTALGIDSCCKPPTVTCPLFL